MARLKGKPATNSAGRMNSLARSGKAPGQRRKEELAAKLGLGLNGKPLEKSPGMLRVEQLHAAALKGEGVEDPENPAWKEDPIVAAYKQRAEMRRARLLGEGAKYREGKEQATPTRLVHEVIAMVRNGHTTGEACDALGVNPYSLGVVLHRDAEAAAALDQARKDYAHARVADIYRRIDEEPDPQRARLYADVVKWEVSKCFPAFYGERMQVEAGPGITFNIGIGARQGDIIDAEPLSKAEPLRLEDANPEPERVSEDGAPD